MGEVTEDQRRWARVLGGTTLTPVRLLGRGTSGEVFLAIDRSRGRLVAVKVFSEQSALHRHRAYTETGFTVDHPHVIGFLHWCHEPARSYLVMEYANGGDLQRWLTAHDDVAPETVVDIARQILSGLAHLHDCSIVHRDLKPSNILLHVDAPNPPIARVGDLGTAVSLHAPWGTLVPTVTGTAGYIAPEVLAGAEADARSDLFAFGLILRAVADRCAGTPPDVAEVIDALTRTDRGERPSSARAASRRLTSVGFWNARDLPTVDDTPAVGHGVDESGTHDVRGTTPHDAGDGTGRWRRALVELDHRLDEALAQLPEESIRTTPPAGSVHDAPTTDEVADRLRAIRAELGLDRPGDG